MGKTRATYDVVIHQTPSTEMAIRDAETTLMIGEFPELLQALQGLFPPIG